MHLHHLKTNILYVVTKQRKVYKLQNIQNIHFASENLAKESFVRQ